jgi:hypothetical protein
MWTGADDDDAMAADEDEANTVGQISTSSESIDTLALALAGK